MQPHYSCMERSKVEYDFPSDSALLNGEHIKAFLGDCSSSISKLQSLTPHAISGKYVEKVDKHFCECYELIVSDAERWFRNFKCSSRDQLSIRTSIYLSAPVLQAFDKEQKRKCELVEAISNLLRLTHEYSPSLHSPVSGAVQSLKILSEKIQNEWTSTWHTFQPLDPCENTERFLKDVQNDLADIQGWIDNVHASIPNISNWMTVLNNMSEVERLDSYSMYQSHLNRIEKHTKSLSSILHLIDWTEKQTISDSVVTSQLTHHKDAVYGLETACHLLWIRLLELTLCIDQNDSRRQSSATCESISSNRIHMRNNVSYINNSIETESIEYGEGCSVNLITNPMEDVKENHPFYWNTCESPPSLNWQNSIPESGFESELSPQPPYQVKLRNSKRGLYFGAHSGFDEAARQSNFTSTSLEDMKPSMELFKANGMIKQDNLTTQDTPAIQREDNFSAPLKNKSTPSSPSSPAHSKLSDVHCADLSDLPQLSCHKVKRRRLKRKGNVVERRNLPRQLITHQTFPKRRESTDQSCSESHSPISPSSLISQSFQTTSTAEEIQRRLRSEFENKYNHKTDSDMNGGSKMHGIAKQRQQYSNAHSQPDLVDSIRLFGADRSDDIIRKNRSIDLKSPIKSSQNKRPYASTDQGLYRCQSTSSPLEGDAFDSEEKNWRARVRSYLTAAANVETMIRSHHSLGTPDINLKSASSSASIVKSVHLSSNPNVGISIDSTDSDLVNIGSSKCFDSPERISSYWDDYQVPPYSTPEGSVCAFEPVHTFTEEYPWDDVGEPYLSDASRDLASFKVDSETRASSQFVPFHSSFTSLTQALNTDEPAVDKSSTLGKQDTMDLSTTTSALFNPKSMEISSMDVSFEVCSPSLRTAASQTDEIYESIADSSFEPTQSFRTHPDGGSQHRIDSTDMNDVPQISNYDAHLSRLPQTGNSMLFTKPQKCRTIPRTRGLKSSHRSIIGRIYHSLEASDSSLLEINDISYPTSNSLLDNAIEWSTHQLNTLHTSLYSILTTQCSRLSGHPTFDDYDTGFSCQNNLSHIIHSAENNLEATLNRLGNVAESDYAGTVRSKSTEKFIKQSTSLQLSWVRLIEEARYWLFRYCWIDSLRNKIKALEVQLETMEPSLDVLRTTNSCTTQCEQKHTLIVLENCLSNSIQLSRSVEELNWGIQEHLTHNDEHDVFNVEQKRTILAHRLTYHSKLHSRTTELTVMVMKYQKMLMRMDPQTIVQNFNQENYRGKPISPESLEIDDRPTTLPVLVKYRSRRHVIFAFGGLVAMVCVCCYVVSHLSPCGITTNPADKWHSVTSVLRSLFNSAFSTNETCPLKRERISVIADYSIGQQPF